MTRKTHLVGSWPGDFGVHAMETALTKLAPHLLRMSDGETGDRSEWIRPTLEWLRANPDVERVAESKTSQDEFALFRVLDGHRFRPEHIELGYLRAFQQSYPAFQVLRERHRQPQISFQVGIPAPFDLAVIAFGANAARDDESLTQAFTRRTLDLVRQIRAEAGDDVIFQIETVIGLVSVARAPAAAQPAVAQRMASELLKLPAAAETGTRFGAHICLGDYHHKATSEAADARPLVLLANALTQSWPAGRPFDYIHVPFAAADEPPSFDEGWYAPLRELALPEGVRLVAGFIHEAVDVDRLADLLATVEGFAGREVDVAATCGLGRRPSPNEAWDAMEKAVALVHAPSRNGSRA
ncbi:MAG TPA: hypothetical protein VKK19_16750 [Candidatus Dormibacteraeota bacterium]|nr:hypothetical protein [Candidatus Dormibacteraeota bacterium]